MTYPIGARVVICGAGVIGAAVAYYLALRGVAATIVERCGVACAASGKSGGFLALDWCDHSPLAALARTSFALHAALAQTLDPFDKLVEEPVVHRLGRVDALP